MHVCPMITVLVPHVGGPIIGPCAPTVLIGSMPAARVSDMLVCVGPPDVIVKGSATVFICGMPAARIGDLTAHGGVITAGFPTVLIGDLSSGGGGAAGLGTGSLAPKSQGKALAKASAGGKPFCARCAALAKQRAASRGGA